MRIKITAEIQIINYGRYFFSSKHSALIIEDRQIVIYIYIFALSRSKHKL
jgi:hypothetical protein